MKLSKKLKLRSWRIKDNEIQRIAVVLTAIVVVFNWLPLTERSLAVTFRTMALTFTMFVPIWMGATAISKVADYTTVTVTLSGLAAFFWASPATLCQSFAEGWTFQSAGVLRMLIIEALTFVITGLVTSSFRARYKRSL